MFALVYSSLHVGQSHFPRFNVAITDADSQPGVIESLAQNIVSPGFVLRAVRDKNVVFETGFCHGELSQLFCQTYLEFNIT